MLDVILNLGENEQVDIALLKKNAPVRVAKISNDKEFNATRDSLKTLCLIAAKTKPPQTSKTPVTDGAKK